jgi:acetate kinase
MLESILVLNAGSSSIKFQVFAVGAQDRLTRQLRGQIGGIGIRPTMTADIEGQSPIAATWSTNEVGDIPSAIDRMTVFLRQHMDGRLPAVVGHRVVHGGHEFVEPTVVDDEVLARLHRLVPLAPLHQPNNLAPIRAILKRRPHVLQVVCFDTAFHRGHPEVADRYAVPESLYAQGVRRYGFHGLSYEFIAQRLRESAPDIARGRVVVAHLGSGASMCALVDGKSVDSTTGFTALDGLPMGTRPGQLDPGVVLHLMSEKNMDAKEIERFLYSECGLKGLSGISSDVRDLLTSDDPRAKRALDYFTYRVAVSTGMLAAAMSGIDAFVFTAGIGENSAEIRERVARRLAWLHLQLSPGANAEGDLTISSERSRVVCMVIPTDEERMIAAHSLRAWRHHSRSQLQEKRA